MDKRYKVFVSSAHADIQQVRTPVIQTPAVRNNKSIFDDEDALIATAQSSFSKAAKRAVAENDRLGIPTHGSIGSELVVRQPHQVRTIDIS